MKSSNKAIPMPISSYHSDIGKVYSLKHTLLLAIVTLMNKSLDLSLLSETLYSLTNIFWPRSPSIVFGNQHSALNICDFKCLDSTACSTVQHMSLAYFTYHSIRWVGCIVVNDRISFLVKLTSVPLCMSPTFSLSFHLLLGTWINNIS